MKKPFKFPFWSLVVLAVLIAAYNLLTIGSSSMSSPSFMSQVMIIVMVDAVIMGEACFYWLNRDRITRRWWAMTHVILLYFVFVLMPVISAVFFAYTANNHSQIEIFQRYVAFQKFRTYAVWIALVSGHIFFIATIVKTLNTKRLQQADASDTTNILDDFSG